MKQTWEKSPFLGRLRLEKSTSGNPEYMSMCTSVVVLVVLLFKWYCLGEETKKFSWVSYLFDHYFSKQRWHTSFCFLCPALKWICYSCRVQQVFYGGEIKNGVCDERDAFKGKVSEDCSTVKYVNMES